MLSQATTVEQCDRAAAKFVSARKVPGYSRSKHEAAISRGVASCNAKKQNIRKGKQHGAGGGDVAGKKPGKQGNNPAPARQPATPSSSSYANLRITDISFCNTDINKNVISGPSDSFYADDVKYICPKIYYEGMRRDADVDIKVKFITPDGDLFAHDGDRYTYSCEMPLETGSNTILLEGWGSDDGGVYYDGTWKCQIWVGGKMLLSAPFTIVGLSDDGGNSSSVQADEGSRYVTINKVWVDHNQYQDGVKGMLIHTDFDAVGMKDHKVYVAAYFYFDDGTPLKDEDGEFSTPDGQVCVASRQTVSYDSSNFSDYKLFIPNDQLHVRDANLKFYVRVEDDTMDDKTKISDYHTFKIGNP